MLKFLIFVIKVDRSCERWSLSCDIPWLPAFGCLSKTLPKADNVQSDSTEFRPASSSVPITHWTNTLNSKRGLLEAAYLPWSLQQASKHSTLWLPHVCLTGSQFDFSLILRIYLVRHCSRSLFSRISSHHQGEGEHPSISLIAIV